MIRYTMNKMLKWPNTLRNDNVEVVIECSYFDEQNPQPEKL